MDVPTPEPQRLLPSLKVVQTNPELQSESVEQVSHSPPLEQPIEGMAVRITSRTQRSRLIVLPLPGRKNRPRTFYPIRAKKAAITFI